MKLVPGVLLIACLVAGCTPGEEIAPPEQVPPAARLEVSITGLPSAGTGEGHYQLWATFYAFPKSTGTGITRHDEGYLSLGEFLIDGTGRLTGPAGDSAHFTVPPGKSAQLLDDMIVTIDPAAVPPDTGDPRHGSVVLGGKVSGDERTGRVNLTTGYVDAFNTDFGTLTGSCSFLAPTADAADSNSGVWFVEQPAAPVAGLMHLPLLPPGWVYEGWVARRDTVEGTRYFTTGKFTRADTVDEDGPGSGSGPGPGLNFPGQDFIAGALSRPDLSGPGFWFMVTLEPSPDTSPAPFAFRLLSSEFVPPGGTPGRTRQLENVTAGRLPGGRVIIHR